MADIPQAKKTVNWKSFCYEFVARNRRVYGLEMIKAPEELINLEKKAIQIVYNNMRDNCLNDPIYIKTWEDIDSIPIPPPSDISDMTGLQDNNSLVPA